MKVKLLAALVFLVFAVAACGGSSKVSEETAAELFAGEGVSSASCVRSTGTNDRAFDCQGNDEGNPVHASIVVSEDGKNAVVTHCTEVGKYSQEEQPCQGL